MNAILLYLDHLSVLEKLTDEQAGRLFKAIHYYSIGNQKQLDDLLSDQIIDIVFSQIKTSMDKDRERYENKCEKRRAAGRLGAEKTNAIRWGNQQTSANDEIVETESSDISYGQQTLTNAKENQQMSVDIDSCHQSSANADSCRQMSAKSANNNNKYNNNNNILKSSIDIDDMSTSKEADDASAIDYKEIVDFWNATTKGTMGTLRSIDHNRRKMVRARIKEHGIGAFREMIENAARSDFMHGTPWASFDWCIKPNNFTKVLEGNYEGRKSGDRIDVSHIRNTNEKSWTL